MDKKIAWFLGLLLIFVMGIGFASKAAVWAQESVSIRVEPALIEERSDPGEVFFSTLKITNLSSETKTFYLLKRDISRLTDKGFPVFAEEGEETGFELSSWIRLSQESVIIPAGETREVSLSVTVPENASPGGHFGGIFAALTPERPAETGAGVGYQVGTLMNLRISGEILEAAQLREFRTDKFVYSEPVVNFTTRVENLGNVLLRPRGPLEITNFFGEEVATLKVNEPGGAVLPGETRDFENVWRAEGLAFGRYQALVGLIYGEDEKKSVSATASFWILPLNIILPVVIGILVVIFGITIGVKLYLRRKMREIHRATEALNKERFGNSQPEIRHRYEAPFPKMLFVAVTLLLLTLFLLIVLFFLFA